MLKFETNGKLGKVVLTFPTYISELTPDFLQRLTEVIQVADNYSLIALCHKEKLSAFVMAGKNNKSEMSTAVVPIFVKKGKTDSEFINSINVSEKLLITPTQLAIGLHVNVPGNTLTMGTLLKHIDGDGYAYQNALKESGNVYFIEFKLIPNCDILGVYKNENYTSFDNPFAISDNNTKEV